MAILIASSLLAPAAPAQAATARIKDIVSIEGVRDNQLVGYGLVVGLNGTGDSLSNSPFTKQSLQAMLERLGSGYRHTPRAVPAEGSLTEEQVRNLKALGYLQ